MYVSCQEGKHLPSPPRAATSTACSVRARLRSDISAAIWHGGPVMAGAGVRVLLPEQFDAEPVHELDGLSLDRLDAECSVYQPAPELLQIGRAHV